jgi:hypothetical protein
MGPARPTRRLDRAERSIPGAGDKLSRGPAVSWGRAPCGERTNATPSAAGARSSAQHRCRTQDADGAPHSGGMPETSAPSEGGRSGGSRSTSPLVTEGKPFPQLSGLSGCGGGIPSGLPRYSTDSQDLIGILRRYSPPGKLRFYGHLRTSARLHHGRRAFLEVLWRGRSLPDQHLESRNLRYVVLNTERRRCGRVRPLDQVNRWFAAEGTLSVGWSKQKSGHSEIQSETGGIRWDRRILQLRR